MEFYSDATRDAVAYAAHRETLRAAADRARDAATPPPARPGMHLTEVETPALLVDLTALESNITVMQGAVQRMGLQLRPHAKTHKCAAIARAQIAAGAVGVCVQKVSEAAALVEAGIADIFISNQVVGAARCARVAALATRARISVAVDDARAVEPLARAAQAAGARIGVLVEVDVGQHRCGIAPGEPAVALVRRIVDEPWLRFEGLQAYHGSAQHLRGVNERAEAVGQAALAAANTRETLRLAGLPCPLVTGGGTGSFVFEGQSGVYDEVQPGSYVFMDADYARNALPGVAPRFAQSLFVLTTVISQNDGRVVVDAGLKSLAFDSGMPLLELPGWSYTRPSDEHGMLVAGNGAPPLAWGDRIRLVPGHCDPTVNLHAWLVGVRDEHVEHVWPIEARGAIT